MRSLIVCCSVAVLTLMASSASRGDTVVVAPDTALSAANAVRLRARLATEPDSSVRADLRVDLVRSLIAARAAADELVAAVESCRRDLPRRPNIAAEIYGVAAEALIARGERLDAARGFAAACEGVYAAMPGGAHGRTFALERIARLQRRAHAPDSAATTLRRALRMLSPDEAEGGQVLQLALGHNEADAGRDSAAVLAFANSLATFGGEDTTAATPLRARWRALHGSLAGLDDHIAAARERSRQRVVFDSKRWGRPLPEFELPKLAGDTLARRDLLGTIVVLDFWGTWCGPCRQALPSVQRMHDRWRAKGVSVQTVDVEFEPRTVAEQRSLVRDFMQENGYTFPVVMDHDGLLVQALGVDNYPTTFVVDASGTIVYRDIGAGSITERIIAEQVEALVKARPAGEPPSRRRRR